MCGLGQDLIETINVLTVMATVTENFMFERAFILRGRA